MSFFKSKIVYTWAEQKTNSNIGKNNCETWKSQLLLAHKCQSTACESIAKMSTKANILYLVFSLKSKKGQRFRQHILSSARARGAGRRQAESESTRRFRRASRSCGHRPAGEWLPIWQPRAFAGRVSEANRTFP
jgi:hypothetical protein